jgi:hypothetical protein
MKGKDAELFLGLCVGAFDHIPVYARAPDLEGTCETFEMERTISASR